MLFPAIGCGLLIALLASQFIYSTYAGASFPAVNTISGMLFLYLLLSTQTKTWFWSGFFIGLLWFWWIGLSFVHYHMPWAIPLVELGIALIYGGIFWLIAKIALSAERLAFRKKSVATQHIPTLLSSYLRDFITIHYSLFTLIIKALGLLGLSYIHPFGFDWFKPELVFIGSYLGIEKWQFALILLALVLTIWKHTPIFLLLILGAYEPLPPIHTDHDHNISLVTLHTPVEEKWDSSRHTKQFLRLFQQIDNAIEQNRTTIILPESVFPVFLNHQEKLFNALHERAKKINIVTGALYWDGKTPRNATYVFTRDGRVTVANKVVLVPFGEANPLPDFLSDWVNRVFYDNAVELSSKYPYR